MESIEPLETVSEPLHQSEYFLNGAMPSKDNGLDKLCICVLVKKMIDVICKSDFKDGRPYHEKNNLYRRDDISRSHTTMSAMLVF